MSDSIKQYIKNNYNDLIDNVDFLPAEERPTPEGTGKEIVVFLGDGLDIIFDSEGNFQREINMWKEFEENLDAGLKFDAERSSDLGGASVHIKKVNFGSDDHFGSLFYRISVSNSEVASDSNVSLEQMELAGNLDSGQEISLTFTYEVGPPRYLVVSGSDVSAFKHRMPEWDKPGSFTIKAKTITPALSENNDISLASAFGLTVEMGGRDFMKVQFLKQM